MKKIIARHKKLVFNIFCVLISTGIAFTMYYFPIAEPEVEEKVNFSGVKKICELATEKVYYHNVAKLEKDVEGIFELGWGKYGYKRFWMEYDTTIDFVIDASEVDIVLNEKTGCVKIYVPSVEVKNAYPLQDTMEQPIIDTGVFTEITLEEKKNALSKAQTDLIKNINKDQNIKERAYENAKRLLAEYVLNLGKTIGKEYTIEWSDTPIEN